MTTLEQLIENNIDIDYPHVLDKYKVLSLLKQVRKATIEECQKIIQVEHRIYNVDGTYKSEVLGSEVLYDLEEPWNYFSTNIKELDNLDLNNINLYEIT